MVAEFFSALSLAAVWLAFFVCLFIILLTGTKLSRYGDIIAVRTGLGGAWIGLVLLAIVTSMPELVTGLSAIIVVHAPDLAVGSALGSCIYNLLIIAILDFVYRGGSIYSGIQHSHSLSAGFGVVLLGALASAIFVQKHFAPPGLGPVGPYALIAPVIYFIGIRSIFYFERRENEIYASGLVEAVQVRRLEPPPLVLKSVYALFAVNAVVLTGAATALPVIGQALAINMGWDETFVGTIFLALVTSVPEVVISVQAVRIGAVDLAIGGLLGSNLFDLVILAIEDFAYLDGPILYAASDQHLLTAIAALTMTGIALVGLCARPRARVFRVVAWTSLGLLAVGLFSALILFLLSP
jgi:cation:H+ antiporter